MPEDGSSVGPIRGIKVKLPLKANVTPVFHRSREPPLPLQAEVAKELDRMVETGVISPVSGSEWASPLVIQRKKNGKVRLCCDYKLSVNECLMSDVCNTPTLETAFSKIRGAKVFAKFDLKSAFWQLELDEGSKAITTINTTKGLFQFNRLPYGLKVSSAVFQRAMEDITCGVDNIIVWQDDVFMYDVNDERLAQRVQSFLKLLNKRNVKVNWEKSVKRATEVVFLGHLISASGIRPDPSLVSVINTMQAPKSVKELERFIGIINFYGSKIRNFAEKCEPLNRLRKKGCVFAWTVEQQQAFELLRKELTNSAVVQPYSLDKEVTLTCDACEYSIGGVLSQNGLPVMYLSRSLSPAERNYANIEKEALSIVWCVKRAEKLLLGRHFLIRTDHRPLEYIFGEHKGIPKTTSARLQRWAILLMAYDYSIRYVAGAQVPEADALSRLRFDDDGVHGVFEELRLGVHWQEEYGTTWDQLVKETCVDRFLQRIKQRVRNGQWGHVTTAEIPYKKNRHVLCVENEVLLIGTRPVIPNILC